MSFFGFIGKALGVVSHILPGPAGLITGAIGGALGGGGTSAPALPYTQGLIGRGRMGLTSGPGGIPTFSPLHPISSTAIGPGQGSSLVPHFACGPGMHHAKVHGRHFLASKCVRNRRMDVSNPRALRRSIRRLYGAEKMYRRLLRVTHPHKTGKIVPKAPRRRRK